MSDNKPSPSIPLKLRILYVVLNLILRFSKRRDGTLNRAILSFFEIAVPPNPARGPVDGVATYDYVVDPARDLSVRYFSPSQPEEVRPVVVYFHGGGFVTGSAHSPQFDSFCRRLSGSLPAHVVSVEYRLAPEHRYPAPCDDGIDVLRWLDSGDGLCIEDLSVVFIAGDSAGGNIAHHVARRATSGEEAYNRIKIVGLAAIQPFFGGEDDTESERRLPFVSRGNIKWIWTSFLPEGSDCDHEVANVFGPGSTTTTESSCGDWSRFPPTMVVVGGLDSLQDRQRCYYEGLRRMGVKVQLHEFPNGVHSFPVFPELPESQQLIQDFRDFVHKCASVKYPQFSGIQTAVTELE